MRFLKQSTASQTRTIGPFIDSADFVSAATGLTVANTDVRLKKNGANDVAKNSGGATHDVNGCYHLTFDATDTDTVGELFYSVKVAGALQVFGAFTVLEEAVYDALFGASAAGYQVPIWAAANSTVNLSATTIKTATDVETDTADIQSRLPAALVSGRMDSNVQAMANNVITAAAMAADAITEIQAGLSTLDAAGVRTAVGLASANLDTQLGAIDDFLDTEVAAIKAKTDNLPSDPADASDVAARFTTLDTNLATVAGYLDTEIAAIKTKTDQLTFSTANRVDSQVYGMEANTVTASALAADAVAEIQSGLSTLTAGQVNAEVLDVLNVDTFAEPGQEAPAATTTIVKKLGYLYKLLRNRVTQDATTFKVYGDDATTVDQKATVSDNGTTFDRGELGTGP